MINILVVDHHPIFRLGLKHLLSQVPEYNILAEAGNGAEAVDLAKKLSPDLVILDLQLSKLDGIKVTRQILAHSDHVKIIALSNFTMEDQVIDMINAGVKGLLFKSDDNHQILNAVEQVLKNEEYFCKGAVEILVNRFARGNPEVRTLIHTSVFSKRELDIIKLICKEKTAKEIGAILFISEKTVDFHRKKIIEKMEVKNMIGLVIYAIKNKIVNIYDTL